MAKGLFTQGMCILLRQAMPIEEIQERLSMLELIARQESNDDDAPETLVYSFREEVGGHLLVTPSASPWPDDMGDPDETPDRFVAWSLGQYGPLAFPGGLARAVAQSWRWDEAKECVDEHACHIRVMISYVMGADEEDDDDLPIVPDDYDAMSELRMLTRAITALLESPDAICYFNPGGEVLRNESGLRQTLNHAWNQDLPPLEAWANLRVFSDDDTWIVMDTVGNGQIDVPDLEAVFRHDQYEPEEVEDFLRSATLYLMSSADDVSTGDTADGPGELSWTAMECEQSLSDPPRPTIRWVPDDGSTPPDHLLDSGEDEFDEMDQLDDEEDFLIDHGLGTEAFDDLDDPDDNDETPPKPPF